MRFEIEFDRVDLQDTIAESERHVDFSAAGFDATIRSGQMLGWLMSGEIFLEDYGFAPYEGDDIRIETIELKEIDAGQRSISLRVLFEFGFPEGEPSDVDRYADAFNALSSAMMLCYWTGEGEEQHPDRGVGMYWFSGEMNRVVVNGHIIHERR